MADHVVLKNLIKEYQGGVRAVNEISFSVQDGEFFSLLGPSGCGKSTLLRTLAGLEQATGGSIEINGEDVTYVEPGKRGIAMVFQDYALFPSMLVDENIAYSLKIKKQKKADRLKTASEYADTLGLSKMLKRRPAQLSGGEQQRVALARAMAAKPDVLLLDEPLSNLDARMRLEARAFLKRYQNESGVTTIFVTHDQSEALAMSDRMAIIKLGVLQQVGTPTEVFDAPVNAFVAQFIGTIPMNLEKGAADPVAGVLKLHGGTLPMSDKWKSLAQSGALPPEVNVGIRPEYLDWKKTLVDGEAGIKVVVELTENTGATFVVHCHPSGNPDQLIRVVVPSQDVPMPGDTGYVTCDSSRVLLFDLESELSLDSLLAR